MILSPLRSGTPVLTADGIGVVMCSARGYVTVLRGRVVAVYALWEVSPIVSDSADERRPVEVA